MSRNKSTFETLTVHLLLNLSRCKRKSGQITEAVEMANKVLRINPDRYVNYIRPCQSNATILLAWIKLVILKTTYSLFLFSFEAYYAKAKANKEAGRLHEAVNDLTEALR